ncbi:hypothetical protein [Tautonia plasticadhaerens]|uniref:Uncharacterized protein n=1 Tax=Tautonia plasticadhaerens TaxID=2527974 RepID=A0A518H906_9BACT|nr:hypothetical protein [Tautonia plasticadhaerens]QDV37337.1 hypothetical protein ElP_52740 [Tautonia plasticadhaerens]
MSRRLNLYGFSLPQMRRLLGSEDEGAIERIRGRLAEGHPHWRQDEHEGVGEIVARAIRHGIPFPDLRAETHLHTLAASALAGDDQDWLVTDASHYHASALEDGLWRRFGRLARPEVKGFLRGLVEGVPLFGQKPAEDGTAYAAIGLEKLRFFRKGLEDLRVQVAYRVSRKRAPSEADQEAVEFLGNSAAGSIRSWRPSVTSGPSSAEPLGARPPHRPRTTGGNHAPQADHQATARAPGPYVRGDRHRLRSHRAGHLRGPRAPH